MSAEGPRKSQDSVAKSDVKDLASQHVESSGELGENELYALRQRYPLLADASPEKLKALNKAVLRKLDWRFLTIITLMLLMK